MSNVNNSLFFINSNTGWVVGSTIMKTTNGGTNWNNDLPNLIPYSDSYNCLHSVFFSDQNTGWVVGSYAAIFSITNGGSTLINQISTETPAGYSLCQNFPNPFNPSTKISFQLPVVSSSSLKIFDITGKEVATLVNERLNAGTYTVDWNASEFPSGVYFYRLTAEGYGETRKMMLIR
ncbi:MAG: T9SS type A sorting domain-containing protein [Ignavibacteriae bacterium]|nr:T9SS type A sorting domain-containing protein [Ignavibacteriota bacterium]